MPAKIIVANVSDNDSRMTSEFVTSDAQGSIDMHGMTLSEAKAELLEQCGEDDQRAEILAGFLTIAE